MPEQTPACLQEAGIKATGLARMQPQLAFQDLRYPVLGILHGLSKGDGACVEESIRELNASLPGDIRC